VELITPHRTNTNYHETGKGGQGPVWAVAPLHHQRGELITISSFYPAKKQNLNKQLFYLHLENAETWNDPWPIILNF
jgi:hypothetical protein